MAKKDETTPPEPPANEAPAAEPPAAEPPATEPPAPPKKAKKVRVICEGYLGTQLLVKGNETSDPEYVALLEDDRNLVELVK